MSKQSKRVLRKKIVGFIERHELKWYLFTAILSFVAIPASLIALPDVDTATFAVSSLTGVTASLASLASAMTSSNDDQEDEEEES